MQGGAGLQCRSESSSMQRMTGTQGNTGYNWEASERVCNMRHKSWETRKGVRGSEGKWKQDRDRQRDIGVSGGSGDHRNKEEKGGKG